MKLVEFDEYLEMCHIGHMKTISIRELHTHTGHYVRSVREDALAVTDRGRVVAILHRPSAKDQKGVSFPKRTLLDLVKVKSSTIDSTAMISEDRDRE